MKKDADILASGFGTAAFDLLFALIAGFAIMPAVFAAGIEPGAGPGLIFETLPYIFGTMVSSSAALGRIVSILFFLTIVVAALTSSISMFEVGAAYLVEERGMSRRKAVIVIFCATWLLGALCSLRDPIFNFCDKLTSNFLMSFGSMLFVIFVGWKMKKSVVYQELTNGGTLKFSTRVFGVVYFFIRYIAPVAIIAIFVTNLLA